MGCCDQNNTDNAPNTNHTTRDGVRDGYAQIAATGVLSTVTAPSGGGCCGSTAKAPLTNEQLAEQLGYDRQQLEALPEGANMGLSCGNPTAIAALEPGQVVVDLGAGGGFDVFLAGPKVGPTGRVIGVDMTPEMLTKARNNTTGYAAATGLDNVEFRLGEIEHLPIADATVDVVISNCVINLSPDKAQVWSEIARVLKPGGKVAASDMALLKPLPDSVRSMFEAMVGCVAGAVLVDEYRAMVETAGLTQVELIPKPQYVQALCAAGDPLYKRIAELLPDGSTPADYITSLDVHARRAGCRCCG